MRGTGYWALALIFPIVGVCQTTVSGPISIPSLRSATVPAQEPAASQIIREIEDRKTGDLWLLTRSLADSAGPGRLVRVAAGAQKNGDYQAEKAKDTTRSVIGHTEPHLQIHAGDALIVEEHTAVVDARLEAVALAPAISGSILRARLRMGGKVVEVVAVGPGRAVLAPEGPVRP
jgi:hypothetical protein